MDYSKQQEIKFLKDIISHLSEHIKEGNYDDLDIQQLKEAKKLLGKLMRFDRLIRGGDIIGVDEIPPTDILYKYSNPKEAQKKAKEYLGNDVKLFKSNRKNKKYMIKDLEGKWVHFGFFGMEDFLKHKNFNRMLRYRKRAENIKGNWRDNPYSPNNLSINILW
jgi:hypothetical protein